MKLSVPLILLSGLLMAGCASDNSNNFSSVPPPSGQPSIATAGAPQSPKQQPAPKPQPKPEAQPQPKPTQSQSIVTPDTSLAGKVVKYNSVGRFVVLSFSASQMPKTDQTLFVYRGGLKTGEVKISGEQRDNYIVADLINGEAQPGDDVRDR